MRRTIADWYANAEGRDSADFRHDWENDDRIDRTPDTWLDRLKPSERVAGSRPSLRGASTARPSGGNALSQRRLADAARELQARMRGIKDATIARHLQQSGWPNVSAEQIRQALSSHPARPIKQPGRATAKPQPPAVSSQSTTRTTTRTKAGGTITVVSPSTGRPPLQTKPSRAGRVTTSPARAHQEATCGMSTRELRSLAEVVRKIEAKKPNIGIKRLAKEVKARGWARATKEQVEAARRLPLPDPPRPTPPRPKVQVLAPTPRTVRPPHPDACLACGVVPTLLGSCRCS